MNLINVEDNITEVQARRMAASILEEEANELAGWEPYQFYHQPERKAELPHRVKISISREIQRLRLIANKIKGE